MRESTAPVWGNDDELFSLCREGLFSAVIGDVMDLMGRTHQFLSPRIQPLRDDMIVVGRAMPVLEADDYGGEGPGRVNDLFNGPFGLMLRALDDLQKNEIYICTGASPDYALWGELIRITSYNVCYTKLLRSCWKAPLWAWSALPTRSRKARRRHLKHCTNWRNNFV